MVSVSPRPDRQELESSLLQYPATCKFSDRFFEDKAKPERKDLHPKRQAIHITTLFWGLWNALQNAFNSLWKELMMLESDLLDTLYKHKKRVSITYVLYYLKQDGLKKNNNLRQKCIIRDWRCTHNRRSHCHFCSNPRYCASPQLSQELLLGVAMRGVQLPRNAIAGFSAEAA